ncbi:MAG: hypothetical protein PHF50_00960 [Patescibacteria group bacterium]|nr:hypothetical protein [Patescibacteria group bacterium]
MDQKIEQILNSSNYFPKPAISPAASPNLPEKAQPEQKTITPEPAKAPAEKPAASPTVKKGYYKNNTYFYEISFPEGWPIRVRSEANVSLGMVPPKNGLGAITIETSPGGTNEIEQAKAEAKKYPGMISITEEPITLAGIKGDKITINNLLAKTKTINILLKKSNLNYIIKYSEESADFISQVNKALLTFKFFK